MRIIVIGDSIVNGFPFRRSFCFTEILRNEYGIETINKGENGDTSEGVLRRFEQDVLAYNPEKVLVMIGTNDFIMGGSVENTVSHIKKMIELAGDDKITFLTPLLTNPAIASRMWMRSDYSLVNEKLLELKESVSKLQGISIIDTQKAFSEYVKEHGAKSSYVDGIHPNTDAHEFLAYYLAGIIC